MPSLLGKEWKVIERSSEKTICILRAIDFPEMFWIKATIIPDELYNKYESQFKAFTAIQPDSDPEMTLWEDTFDRLFTKIAFRAIDHDHEIDEAILYTFDDMTAHFRAIWKD